MTPNRIHEITLSVAETIRRHPREIVASALLIFAAACAPQGDLSEAALQAALATGTKQSKELAGVTATHSAEATGSATSLVATMTSLAETWTALTPTASPSPSATPSATTTETASATLTFTLAPTETASATPSATATNTATETALPTQTPNVDQTAAAAILASQIYDATMTEQARLAAALDRATQIAQAQTQVPLLPSLVPSSTLVAAPEATVGVNEAVDETHFFNNEINNVPGTRWTYPGEITQYLLKQLEAQALNPDLTHFDNLTFDRIIRGISKDHFNLIDQNTMVNLNALKPEIETGFGYTMTSQEAQDMGATSSILDAHRTAAITDLISLGIETADIVGLPKEYQNGLIPLYLMRANEKFSDLVRERTGTFTDGSTANMIEAIGGASSFEEMQMNLFIDLLGVIEKENDKNPKKLTHDEMVAAANQLLQKVMSANGFKAIPGKTTYAPLKYVSIDDAGKSTLQEFSGVKIMVARVKVCFLTVGPDWREPTFGDRNDQYTSRQIAEVVIKRGSELDTPDVAKFQDTLDADANYKFILTFLDKQFDSSGKLVNQLAANGLAPIIYVGSDFENVEGALDASPTTNIVTGQDGLLEGCFVPPPAPPEIQVSPTVPPGETPPPRTGCQEGEDCGHPECQGEDECKHKDIKPPIGGQNSLGDTPGNLPQEAGATDPDANNSEASNDEGGNQPLPEIQNGDDTTAGSSEPDEANHDSLKLIEAPTTV